MLTLNWNMELCKYRIIIHARIYKSKYSARVLLHFQFMVHNYGCFATDQAFFG